MTGGVVRRIFQSSGSIDASVDVLTDPEGGGRVLATCQDQSGRSVANRHDRSVVDPSPVGRLSSALGVEDALLDGSPRAALMCSYGAYSGVDVVEIRVVQIGAGLALRGGVTVGNGHEFLPNA